MSGVEEGGPGSWSGCTEGQEESEKTYWWIKSDSQV